MNIYFSALKNTYWRPEAQLEWALFKDRIDNWLVKRIRAKQTASNSSRSLAGSDRDLFAAATPTDWPGLFSTAGEAKTTLGLRSGAGSDEQHQQSSQLQVHGPLGRTATSLQMLAMQDDEIDSEIQAIMGHDIPEEFATTYRRRREWREQAQPRRHGRVEVSRLAGI